MFIALRRFHGVLLLAVLLAVAGIGWRFAVHDGLSSFADDSVSYLLMGQYLSPWSEGGPAVREAYAEQAYPPLLPLVLAVTGAAHSVVAAHVMVLVCLLGVCLLVYRFAAAELDSPALGLVATVLFAVSPAVWINVLGILSENLYLLLSLAVLLAEGRWRRTGGAARTGLLLGGLLGACVLTRTIGVSLVLAFCALGAHRSARGGFSAGVPWALPAAAALALVVVGHALWPGALTEHYLSIWSRVWQGLGAGEDGEWSLVAHVGPQLTALYEAWYTSWLIYWVHVTDVRYLATAGFGFLALVGLGLRARAGGIDAWYVIFYLLVLLLWPAPGQMTRFVYPILPLSVVHALYALRTLAALTPRIRRPRVVAAAGALMMALLVAPSVAFLYHRAQAPDDRRITEYYRHPDLTQARAAAAEQRAMFRDMKRIRRSTPATARVLWFTPAYIALLADRRGERLPWRGDRATYVEAVRRTQAEYVYLSRLNPRMTGDAFDGLRLLPRFRGWTRAVWVRRSAGDGAVAAVLLRVDRERLRTLP
ncbi:MAG: hypothetical protein GWN84_15775 [Gammaproteobacteria bacterium]|nr:hypothetical protein [Gammaproteobacteria bacterium]NIR84242.1 hypothetical protein [Gammaproteobacteria bacterium]NIR89712.1 hypothetical protein [Gammaproteobacteria bacterium]NIU05400.1 hypothetical protein [Gammaproteobacteria bacterium]NIV52346.1 hypothetical protein [Gammaproteobacteria bacterium]